jgi:hypothetical protein
MTSADPTPLPEEPATEGVSPGSSSGVSPAPEPPTPTTDGSGSGPSGVPIGTAPSGGRGCLGKAAAVLVLLSGSVAGAGYAVIHAWRVLTG